MATTTRSKIEPRPEFAGILREEERFADGDDGDFGNGVNGWFDRLMAESGLDVAPSLVVFASLCSAIAFGGGMFVLQENPVSAALAAFLGLLVPVALVMAARSRRQSTMLKQLPDAVDELARAARTGRSLEQCLAIVARDTPAPLGDELRTCTRKIALGMPLEPALREIPRRTGVTVTNVLVMALALHNETGGDLVHVLERLAQTIRDRLAFLGRLRVATTASRATAILMLVLPPAILTFFVFRDPEYLARLFDSGWGRTTTLIAIGLQIVGSIWVLRILKTSQRT